MVEVTVSGTRDGKPLVATQRFITSLRTTPKGPLQQVRGRWSLESWNWIPDPQLREDAHPYRGNGDGVMAALRTAALNLLRMCGFDSIRAKLKAVMHAITALLTIVLQKLGSQTA